MSESMWRKLRSEFPSYSWDEVVDQSEDRSYVAACLTEFDLFFDIHRSRCEAYLSACQEQGVRADRAAYSMVRKVEEGLGELRLELESLLHEATALGAFSVSQRLKFQRLYRAAVQARVTLQRSLAWTSTSYYHSVLSHSFEPDRYGEFGAFYNYDRNFGFFRASLTKNIAALLEVSPDRQEVLLTSSGMAAFSLLENYLIGEVLSAGDTIYYPRALYGETDAVGFRNERLFSIIRDDLHDEAAIAERIRELHPGVVVIEGMQNYLGNRILDVRRLLSELESRPPATPVHLILDETLLGGGYPLRDLRSLPTVQVLTYLSGTKYLQYGLDSQLLGAVVVPKELSAPFQKLNDYLGLSLTEVSALSYPQFPRAQFERRMKRLTRNALAVCAVINDRCGTNGTVQAFHPLIDQPELREAFAFSGSLLTIRAEATKSLLGDGNFAYFRKAVRSVVDRCQELQIPIAYTEGFGFSIPRIYVGWCKNFPPYLRISAGDQSLTETVALAHAVCEGLENSKVGR